MNKEPLHNWAWGYGSVGRAPPSHGGGQGFESPYLHHANMKQKDLNPRGSSPFAFTWFMAHLIQIINVIFNGLILGFIGSIIKRLPDSELEIMMIIWEANRTVTSAYVSEKLKDKREWKITLVLTFLARLVGKGFVTSTREGKVNIYSAVIGDQEYLENESKSFLEKLYSNSLTTFVSTLYKSNVINTDDLAELRQFIDKATKGE